MQKIALLLLVFGFVSCSVDKRSQVADIDTEFIYDKDNLVELRAYLQEVGKDTKVTFRAVAKPNAEFKRTFLHLSHGRDFNAYWPDYIWKTVDRQVVALSEKKKPGEEVVVVLKGYLRAADGSRGDGRGQPFVEGTSSVPDPLWLEDCELLGVKVTEHMKQDELSESIYGRDQK